jgi:hypothetical protein
MIRSVNASTVVSSVLLLLPAVLWTAPAAAQSAGATSSGAQPSAHSWVASPDGVLEIRPYAGGFIPTGPARPILKDALLAGAQVSVRVIPQFAVTGTFGWSPNTDRLLPGEPTLDIYQYDIGVEARGAGWLRGGGWDLTPFIGLGGGGRTYDFRDLDARSTTDVDGYGALGVDFGYGRLGLRLEARDYVSQFHPLPGSDAATTNHNDIALMAGLRVRL